MDPAVDVADRPVVGVRDLPSDRHHEGGLDRLLHLVLARLRHQGEERPGPPVGELVGAVLGGPESVHAEPVDAVLVGVELSAGDRERVRPGLARRELVDLVVGPLGEDPSSQERVLPRGRRVGELGGRGHRIVRDEGVDPDVGPGLHVAVGDGAADPDPAALGDLRGGQALDRDAQRRRRGARGRRGVRDRVGRGRRLDRRGEQHSGRHRSREGGEQRDRAEHASDSSGHHRSLSGRPGRPGPTGPSPTGRDH